MLHSLIISQILGKKHTYCAINVIAQLTCAIDLGCRVSCRSQDKAGNGNSCTYLVNSGQEMAAVEEHQLVEEEVIVMVVARGNAADVDAGGQGWSVAMVVCLVAEVAEVQVRL
jgi:hypothetical protein